MTPMLNRRSSSSSSSARVSLGQRAFASTEEYGPDEELALVDQPGLERVRRDVRAAHGQITRGRGFHVADRVGVEAALEPSLGGRCSLQRLGDDLVRRLPDVREVGTELRLGGPGGVSLPDAIVS
jgi:hypothetical protein